MQKKYIRPYNDSSPWNLRLPSGPCSSYQQFSSIHIFQETKNIYGNIMISLLGPWGPHLVPSPPTNSSSISIFQETKKYMTTTISYQLSAISYQLSDNRKKISKNCTKRWVIAWVHITFNTIISGYDSTVGDEPSYTCCSTGPGGTSMTGTSLMDCRIEASLDLNSRIKHGTYIKC